MVSQGEMCVCCGWKWRVTVLLGPCAILRESRSQEGTMLPNGKLVWEQAFASGSPSAALLSARPPAVHALTRPWHGRGGCTACLIQEMCSSCWGKRAVSGIVVYGHALSSMYVAEHYPLPLVFSLELLLGLDALSCFPVAHGPAGGCLTSEVCWTTCEPLS